MTDVHERLRRLLLLVPYVAKHPGLRVEELAKGLGLTPEDLGELAPQKDRLFPKSEGPSENLEVTATYLEGLLRHVLALGGECQVLGPAQAVEQWQAMARQVPLPVNPSMNGLFIAEPFNGLRTALNLFQTHPPLERRLMNLIGRESTGRVGSDPREPGRGRVAFY